ncbi:Hypp8007 [Branchiostoma lanceolatum]|uniref:Hypp8007 protein n=1 Tax=Branchiostoma lanceolatum TaxID=7740 RepID=A0A8K0EEC7_BRALA|nr:Hypp8007 [Branchiostoma lanceolatum]
MANNGPTNPNGSFIYDTAVYYDESDPRKSDIQTYRDKLEHNKWGFSVCDPHRDGHGEQMKRFKQSFLDSRHAVVFLSPDVLKRMNENLEDGVEFRMGTFLARILESYDTKMKRRLIPVMFGTEEGSFQKPFLLSDFSILCPEKRGFHRHLYRSLSKLPGPNTITQRQIRQGVDTMGRQRYTDRAVTEVATGLEIPEEVLEDIKQEYGGHKAMLIETIECWRLRHGPEATVAILDRVLEMSATSTPLQVADLPPQSMVRTQVTQEPPSITPIQRQTTTCEVQRNAEGTSEAPDTVDENLTVNSEEAQLHELELLSESDAVNNATQAHNSDENELTETEGPQLSPEPEVDNNVAEPPETSEENLSDGAEGSQLVHLEQEVQRNADETDKAPNTAENLTVNSEEAQPHESAVNNATEGHNSDEGELTETEGARLSPEPEVDNNAAQPPETTERNLSDGAEGSHLVHLEQELQRNADETDEAPNTAENLTVQAEEAQPHESEVDNNAAEPPEVTEENLSDGAEGSQIVHLEQVVNVEADNNAAKPPETSEEKLSDGAEGSQLIPLEQGTRNVIVNYNIRNIYITNTEMVQVGDSNSIQVSQTDVGEENLEEEEEEDGTPDVEEATAAGSQQGTASDTSNDQNTDWPVDMQQFEEDCKK